jgi:hypothetical protein
VKKRSFSGRLQGTHRRLEDKDLEMSSSIEKHTFFFFFFLPHSSGMRAARVPRCHHGAVDRVGEIAAAP